VHRNGGALEQLITAEKAAEPCQYSAAFTGAVCFIQRISQFKFAFVQRKLRR
jgi:hypothetical protein